KKKGGRGRPRPPPNTKRAAAAPTAATGIRRTFATKLLRKRLSRPEHQPVPVRETNMRSFLLIAAAVLSFSATMTFETTEANAVVCARGGVRAGCAGARGAVVVSQTAAA